MIKLKENKNENRKDFLVRLAIAFLNENSGYSLENDTLYYDDAECDGYCLAEDLKAEFNIDDE